jgi:predicted DNA-binding transcriptional regulator YafY
MLALTRRAFAAGMSGSLAALGIGDAAAAADPRSAPGDAGLRDADLRDAALRGLARAGDAGDPVLAERADAAIARLAIADPEAAMLARVYRLYDVAAASHGYGRAGANRANADDLATLHGAVRDCRAVWFRYYALDGELTTRTALPLALVHPPQGIKLLAWCEKRQDFRQFFVRAMSDLKPRRAIFAKRRLTLLRGLAESAPWA